MQDSKRLSGARGWWHREKSTLHNCDGGDFVVVENGNGKLQQLLVHGKERALPCPEQLNGPDRDS
jgi:hypothetical protein